MPNIIQELGKKAKGAPKGNTFAKEDYSIKGAIHYALTNYEHGDIKRGQALKRIAKKAIEDALEGNQAAREWLCDRSEGKAVAREELTGKDGGALDINLNVTFR